MICSRCNTYNPNDACFCRHCGRKFADTESDKFSASISVLNQKLSSSIANNTKLRKDIAEQTETLKRQEYLYNKLSIEYSQKVKSFYILLGLFVILLVAILLSYLYIHRNNYIDYNSNELTIIDPRTSCPVYTLTLVEHGKFVMGKTEEMLYSLGAIPSHSVVISDDFYIGETEVTNLLWDWVMYDTINTSKNSNYPKNLVSWTECTRFISKLNKKTGMAFRLPTEAEWEFAARGGNSSPPNTFSGNNDFKTVGWFGVNSKHQLHEVKSLVPNALGLYDMSGNLWEWCEDIFENYSDVEIINPSGPATGDLHTIRGGGYENEPVCDISFRIGYANKQIQTVGFRIALTKE